MKSLLNFKIILFVIYIAVLTGCSSINSSVGGFFNMDTDLEIKFKVDADVNPDDDRKPSPLFVRMYQLKSTKMFNRANFIDLYEKDKEILGADMISKQKLRRIKPGENRDEHFVLNKETNYIGLYAEFLDYKNSSFKLLIPVVPTNVVGTSEDVLIAGNKLIHLSGNANVSTKHR
ncbi:MAG: type VI secretion system lipoprotein TssJ [Gammaproteobacteria bacterium]|nr:type VI secretion system lipoprotein TssJ [Gammaproteobacteria bacterium]MCW8988429.1 type VI secretion system lipoprotein TssJ [Gammaproteobacteria bacterium]